MKIITRLQVPTGDILVVEGSKGPLELVSLGDYGKEINLKADFLGLERPLESVKHTDLLSLEEKWVITVSTQYGCRVGCKFCDVPLTKLNGTNATTKDVLDQIFTGMSLHPEVVRSDRLNVHFARMGEPSFNPNVLTCAKALREVLPQYNVHPVVSTMMPAFHRHLDTFIKEWVDIKNFTYKGNAGLQLSINSTNEVERAEMFNNNCLTLERIAAIMNGLIPEGRKFTLNFAVADYEIDPSVLLKFFDPDYFLIKLTPMHKTHSAKENGIETKGDYTQYYPYSDYEEALKKAGYDVLVFIASKEEDEGLITCGNAILSGSMPTVEYKEM